MEYKNIPCVILCGGKSSRMGEDKALLPFGTSNSLTKYLYKKLQQVFSRVYLSSKSNKFDFIEDEFLLLDKSDIYSPLVALSSIFENLKDEKIFIITVDTPFVKQSSIEKLLYKSKNCDIVVAKTQRTHNLCGVYSRETLLDINRLISEDKHKVRTLFEIYDTKFIEFEDEDEFINLNRKEDYKRALELMSKGSK